MYDATSHSIRVTVEPEFLEDQSSPEDHHYVWAYRVNIHNDGADTVQLLMRHWKITDSLGRVQEVSGAGVVGEQPVLEPGESFEYQSGCPLSTASGMMMGSYTMVAEGREPFDVDIPAFSLDSPYEALRVN